MQQTNCCENEVMDLMILSAYEIKMETVNKNLLM